MRFVILRLVVGALGVFTSEAVEFFTIVFARLASAEASAELIPSLAFFDDELLRLPLDLLLVVLLMAFALVL